MYTCSNIDEDCEVGRFRRTVHVKIEFCFCKAISPSNPSNQTPSGCGVHQVTHSTVVVKVEDKLAAFTTPTTCTY